MVLQKVALRDESGQVLALGALSMLVLALMLMLSFNLSEAIHNKIQLQQQADAEAYSMAVVEARTFNYIAFSNRAIAADLVAMTTMHAYMSMMSSEVGMLQSGAINMAEIMVEELGMCDPPYGLIHCWHAFDAAMKMVKYLRARRKYGGRVKDLEKLFNTSIELLRVSLNIIHLSQWLMFTYAAQVVSGQSLSEIQKFNDPQSSTSLPGPLLYRNLQNLACAAQGSPIDFLCRHDRMSDADQSKLLAEVANASRPKFTTSRGMMLMWEELAETSVGQDLMYNIPGSGSTLEFGHSGSAKVLKGKGSVSGSQEGFDAKDVGAADSGMTMSFLHDGFGVSGYSADIFSDSGGGKHDPGVAHSGQHKEFKGLHDCWSYPKTCFIKFRADKNKKDNYDQPLVYYYATRDLSVTRGGGHGPWELNKQGQVKIGFGSQTGSLTLRAGQGAALSQAMVYYHRLGDWQDAPNFFSPYWRAKLHPMDKRTAATVLILSGNSDAAEIAAAGGPVE